MSVTAPPRANAHADPEAVRRLDDAAYIARAIVECCKLMIALMRKRWPEVG